MPAEWLSAESPMIMAIRAFLDVALGPAEPDMAALADSLDTLAVTYYATPTGAPSKEDFEPPAPAYKTKRSELKSRFPMLGFYAADPSGGSGEKVAIGDAIDDIVDIANDLIEIVWRWYTLGADDAHWHFRLGYQGHWGPHLHELRTCLRAGLFDK